MSKDEKKSISFNVNLGTFLGTVIYLTIGLFFYTVWYAPEVFTWNDPWIFIIMVLWPIAVMWELAWILLYILLAVAAGGLIWIAYDRIRSKINGTPPTPLWER